MTHRQARVRRLRWTVGLKLFVPLLALGVALAAAGTYASHRVLAARLEEQMLARAQVIANAVNYAAEVHNTDAPGGRLGGGGLVRTVVALGGERDVDLIVVVGGDDPARRVVACTRNGWIGLPAGGLPRADVGDDLSETLDSRRQHGELAADGSSYQFTVPLILSSDQRPGRRAAHGAVTVRLDARGVRGELAATARLASGFAAAFVALVVALTWLLVRRVVVRRVGAICRAIDRRTAGDPAAHAPVTGSDEVDAVAGTLNRMIDSMAATEARLRRQLEFTTAITASLGEGLYAIDEAGRVTFVNPAAERILGWRADELLGRDAHGTFHHRHADGTPSPRDGCPLVGVLRSGRAAACEDDVFTRRDGTGFPVAYSSSPITDGGRVVGAAVAFRDVSDRKAAERAVRDSEARLRSFVENAPAHLFIKDLDGRFVMINPRLEQLMGLPADRLLGRTVDDLFPPAVADPMAADDRLVLAENRAIEFREVAPGADGRTRTFASMKFPLADAAGGVRGIAGVAVDVTEQVAAEAALRDSEEQYRTLVSNLPGAVYRCDVDERWTMRFLSDAAGRITGYPADSFVGPAGRSFAELIDPADDERNRAEVAAAVAARRPFSVQYRLRHADGSVRWVYETGQAQLDAAGRPLWLDGVMFDVTERRLADDRLRASEELLRRMFDSSVDCIKTLSLDGRLMSMNACGQQLMEVDDFRSVADAEWAASWPGAGRAAAERALADARGGRVGRFEGCCPTAKGTPKWWHVVVSPIMDAAGRPERLLSVSRDVTDRHAAEEQLRHASLHDGLTGLPNRALFLDRVGRCLERARRDPGHAFAVLFLDLDRFKLVNDSLGHAAGDRLLTEVAGRVAGCLRGTDSVGRTAGGGPGEAGRGGDGVVARLGGDEFTVLLDELRDPGDAARVAERILAAVARPVDVGGQEVEVTASVGVVAGRPGYADAADLLRDADAAMYKAKAAGKNRYAVFDDTLHTAAVARLRLEADLRRAIDRGEFELHYQPIVSLATRAVAGFEALVRWRRDGRLVSPVEFIPVAEDTGLILPLGRWVLAEACRQLAAWRGSGIGCPASVSVNVSRRQLGDPELLPHLKRVLTETKLEPAAVKLEITESVVMEDMEAAGGVLRRLKEVGVRLSMDDFGTGYSSLSCLHRLPLDELKLDRSFVAHLEGRRDAAAVVNAVVGLAHNLGVAVVAEGLEKPEQVAFLQALDCDYGQGYLFARPMPAADVERFLAASAGAGADTASATAA